MTDLERAILHIKTRADAWAVKEIEKALSQEPTEKPMCDRNICLSNEYNGIGCDECVVNKEQEPCDECRNKRSSFCGNCKEYDEFEPCDDAISRKSILKYIDDWWSNSRDDIEDLIIYITYLPSVTQKTGKWVLNVHDIPICSQCGYMTPYDRVIDDYEYGNFCPNCGAKMESEDLGDYPDTIHNQFDNMTGSMNL